jgi:hypothetical protein
MNFVMLPNERYIYSLKGYYKKEYDESQHDHKYRKFYNTDSELITLDYDTLIKPIVINFDSLKFKKSSMNTIQTAAGRVIYDIDLHHADEFESEKMYMYEVKCFNYWFMRYRGLFVPEADAYFIHRNELYYFNNSKKLYDKEQLNLLFKKFIYIEDVKFKLIEKEIKYFEKNQDKIKDTKREPIPEDVRFEVWRRDEGKCVQCGSKSKLEFDHIIPF